MRLLWKVSLTVAVFTWAGPGFQADQKSHYADLTTVAEAERASALSLALGYQDWPTGSDLYLLPSIDRSVLPREALNSTELRGCTPVVFSAEPWPRCTWSWTGIEEPNNTGIANRLELTIVLTPDSRAAREYLLVTLTRAFGAIGDAAEPYQPAERLHGLGSVAFLASRPERSDTSATFLRGTLVVHVRGQGGLSRAVLAFASVLDDQLVRQGTAALDEVRAQAARLLRR